jgi:redox-sensitive bicupin YhaK (pirin superfamily)
LLPVAVCILYPVFIAGTKNLRGRYILNVRDPGLKAGADFVFDVPEDHTAMIVVFTGRATIEGRPGAGEAEAALPARCGPHLKVLARSDGDRPP